MKTTRKFMAILMVFAMIMSMGILSAFAAGTGTITITNAQAGNTYKVYKVFDAEGNGTNISYKVMAGKESTHLPTGFEVDTEGNVTRTGDATLTEAEIAEIAAYVAGDTAVATKVASGTTVTIGGLANGYYYITTTTGTLVTIDSTNPNADVEDKNDAPVLNKKITSASSYDDDGKKALAQVGTDVTYTVTIDVKEGAVGYEFHDVMDHRLAYKADTLKITVDGADVDPANYDKTTAAGDTITVKFTDTWIKTQAGKTITITYNATITAEALNDDPARNTATLDYGNNGQVNTTPEQTTKTYTAKFTVTKNDGNSNPLAGAGFVLMNDEYKYYKLDGNVVTWVDDIADADEHVSNAAGAVAAFTGLANGTYTLVEKTVPAGYNKAADKSFTVAEHDYTAGNLQQTATVINNSGTKLPSTGGMGTVIFIACGSVLTLAAVVFLVTKKRMQNMGVN